MDQFFDIKNLFKMSEAEKGVEEDVGAVLEDPIKAAEFLKILQDCMECCTDYYNITKHFCKKVKFSRGDLTRLRIVVASSTVLKEKYEKMACGWLSVCGKSEKELKMLMTSASLPSLKLFSSSKEMLRIK